MCTDTKAAAPQGQQGASGRLPSILILVALPRRLLPQLHLLPLSAAAEVAGAAASATSCRLQQRMSHPPTCCCALLCSARDTDIAPPPLPTHNAVVLRPLVPLPHACPCCILATRAPPLAPVLALLHWSAPLASQRAREIDRRASHPLPRHSGRQGPSTLSRRGRQCHQIRATNQPLEPQFGACLGPYWVVCVTRGPSRPALM